MRDKKSARDAEKASAATKIYHGDTASRTTTKSSPLITLMTLIDFGMGSGNARKNEIGIRISFSGMGKIRTAFLAA